MTILNILKKIAVKLEKKEDALFSYPIEKQKEYLNHIDNPVDDCDRSYNQYLCQKKMSNRFVTILLDVASYPILLLLIAKYKKQSIKNSEHIDAVFLSDGKPQNIIPNSINEAYPKIKVLNTYSYKLLPEDIEYLKLLSRRYPFAGQFILKSCIKMAEYRAIEMQYTPKVIIVCAEYSFTSSLLTCWCEKNEIQHFNVMHGEKLFYMRDSFFRFHKCYVWDEYYQRLFVEEKADKNQFLIEIPDSMRFKEDDSIEKEFDYTYYLGNESKDILMKISKALLALNKRGAKIAVRPHPRYSDINVINNLFGAYAEIEQTDELIIEYSILRSRNVISLYSTVLNQAVHNNVGIVIDDVSAPERYNRLKELKYIYLSGEQKHTLLSSIIGR